MESDESFCVLFRARPFLCTSGLVSYCGSEHRLRLCAGGIVDTGSFYTVQKRTSDGNVHNGYRKQNYPLT